MERNNKTEKKSKGIKMYIPLIIITVFVLSGVAYWYSEYSKYITTDDAHIDSDNVSVSSKILGRIAHLYADEGDSVKEGTLMAELDSTDLLAQKYQLIALKEQAAASQVQSVAKYNYDHESIKVLEIAAAKAQEDFVRAKNQYAGDVITKEQYEHTQKANESAKAQLSAAKKQLNVSKAQVVSAQASITSAQKQVEIVETQLRNTKLIAPSTGIIAKRWLLPGDVAQPGQSILTITNSQKLWVSVFMEETKVSKIHLNQRVRYTVDAYPGVLFAGKVYSIGSNTASQFSLIPANNASGNFTKVTQRIQLKVSIDGPENKSDKTNYKFLSGMSVVVKIVKD
ncbi:MAG: HlyD family secretion protein [Bacteroidota bacterium]|nr:HlyD family secretion protein [Bacteroidota bacterium]MDP4206975.1 HlyD family secretion protein [Bacteroidota bacterium]